MCAFFAQINIVFKELIMRCAIYTRVSTDTQTSENQLIELRKIAASKSLTFVRKYLYGFDLI